jgi:hypothetical protein
MKTEKTKFRNIKDILNRDEMKSIMAGSGRSGCGICAWGQFEWCTWTSQFGCMCNNGAGTVCN